ncbi:MAG: methionine synthase [Candidatus Hydrogenedens sp.]|jgi:5-methyltetrahydrofolate--homocysteine methyltransferase|nr:methionine synthase [Candidatus Hydrogenedens sp.]
MADLLKLLADRKILLSDGGWGSYLIAAGMEATECPELWNLERPEEIRAIARMYAEAGADVVMTNSFGSTALKLASYGLSEQADAMNEAAARLSREAVGEACVVLGSMGPTGKLLMMGDVTEEEIYDSFARQARALERGGADAVAVETMSALDEAALGVRAVKENTGLVVVASFTFDDRGEKGYRTMMGVSPEEMGAAMVEAGADLLGVNCTLSAGGMVGLVAALHQSCPDHAILVHPNAGQPQCRADGRVYYLETPEEMASHIPELVDAGARIIGGCCGTGPDHIRALHRALETFRD